MVLNILNNNNNFSNLNDTLIFLILKTYNPIKHTSFHLISLCSVTLKILMNTIANTIKPHLDKIVNPYTSVFVPGRLIIDNIILAFESFHTLNKVISKNKGYVGFKLDMAKAYDRIEWDFIENILKATRFPTNITGPTMTCIKYVSFSININGKNSRWCRPTRGIMQGGPLSPTFSFFVQRKFRV